MLVLLKHLNQITNKYPWNFVFFTLLIIILHLVFQWLNYTQLWPLSEIMKYTNNWSVKVVFNQSDSLLKLLGLNYYHENNTFFINAVDGNLGWMEINSGCTSLRAWFYWFFTLLIFSGPLRHKLWYLPVGLIIIYLLNLARIASLGIVLNYTPYRFHFFHSILGTVFYGIIFFMWVVWIEKFHRSH